jgi:ArsR family transcriptional regulator
MSQVVFEALSSMVRRQILAYLSEADLTASEIAGRFEMSKPAISKHLALLSSAGLIASEKKGQYVHYSLVREGLVNSMYDFLTDFCPVSRKYKKESEAIARYNKAKESGDENE